jgi:hypothetical protein
MWTEVVMGCNEVPLIFLYELKETVKTPGWLFLWDLDLELAYIHGRNENQSQQQHLMGKRRLRVLTI